MEEMIFDSPLPTQVKMTIAGKKYILLEADGEAQAKWKNVNIRGAKLDDGRVVGMGDVAQSEIVLVSECLCQMIPGPREDEFSVGPKVPFNTIKAWKGSLVRELYDKIMDISNIREGESPERRALLLALSREDAPIKLEDLRHWVSTLPNDKEHRALHKLVEESPEERAKNLQSSGTVGSDSGASSVKG